MKTLSSLSVLMLLVSTSMIAVAGGQASDSSSVPEPALIVRADVDSAFVLLDGHSVGRTPVVIDTIAPGVHILKIMHSDVSNWLAGVLEDTLHITKGDHRVCQYRFRQAIIFSTVPAGASVYIRDTLVGITPMLLTNPQEGQQPPVAISKDGYEPSTVIPWDTPRGYATFSLTPISQQAMEEDIISASPPAPRVRPTRIFVSGAAMAATGIVTAYLKIKADNRQDLYLQTGDPGLLAERNRLDRGAALTLVLTQIGFGFFVYYLLSE